MGEGLNKYPKCPYENQGCGYDSVIPKPCISGFGLQSASQYLVNARYCPYAVKFEDHLT